MNTGQTLLTLAAVMILTQMAIRINASIIQTQETMQNSKFGLVAVSLATSIIEEATKTAFDENTIGDMLITPKGLTSVGSFGPDAGEKSPPTFDDFDDWHGYETTTTDPTLMSAQFKIKCKVEYVNPDKPDQSTSSNTFHKKLTVYVSSVSMKDVIEISTVYSYWKFR